MYAIRSNLVADKIFPLSAQNPGDQSEDPDLNPFFGSYSDLRFFFFKDGRKTGARSF